MEYDWKGKDFRIYGLFTTTVTEDLDINPLMDALRRLPAWLKKLWVRERSYKDLEEFIISIGVEFEKMMTGSGVDFIAPI